MTPAMASTSLALLLMTLLMTSSAEPTRWSRQISSYTADLGDWVPLPGPVEGLIERQPERLPSKRQAVAEPRILSEPYPPFPSPGFGQDSFPSRTFLQTPSNRQLYLQSVPSIPSAPQNFLTDQGFQGNQGFGQSIRFGLSQPNFPLSQGFVAPQLSFEPSPQMRPPGPQRLPSQNPIKFEGFTKAGLPVPQQAKPFNAPPKPVKPAAPKFVDGYQIENSSNTFSFPQNKKPVSLQKLKYDFDKPKIQEPAVNKQKSEREEVQLLYVPVESLNRGQFNFRNPLGNGQVNGEFYNQNLPKPQYQQFASDFQRPVTKPLDNFNFGPEFYAGLNNLKEPDQIPKFSTISSPFPTLPPTTPRPKKLKPHQPPLAVFLAQESKKTGKVKVGDVLSSLKNAKTISVLDSVDPSNAPKVFIGPSSLIPPESYVKFELPYLSNIENSDRKLKQLPFFVAPLSYNTPDGFAKIPFPSPHVGSVIVNAQARDAAFSSTPAADIIPNSYTATPPSYKQDKSPQKPTFSYYSTAAPKTNPPPTPNEFQSNYYSFEPQTVTSIRPNEPEVVTAPPKPGSYYVDNNAQYQQQRYEAPVRNFKQPETTTGQQYTTSQRYTARPQANYEVQSDLNTQEPVRGYNSAKQTKSSTTPRTTVATRLSTTRPTTETPAPYHKQLLETHNPYSINQAFYQSTPVDYQHYYEEYKEGVSTPSTSSQEPSPSPTPSSSITPETTERAKYQSSSSPNYLQNYSPEIHYESEVQNARFPEYNANDYTTQTEADVGSPGDKYISSVQNQEYNRDGETPLPVQSETPTQGSVQTSSNSEREYQPTREPNVYNQYSNSAVDYKEQEPSTTTSSTTTARNDRTRTSVRTRGRPRYPTYTTTPRSEANEVTRATSTRRPLRERRPLPTRSRYEPNKITTERATRKPAETTETTTKSSRQRVRGRVHYKASENDDVYDKKKSDKKEDDLSYQRDVLHQNYPVTLMERMSTVDIEAMTEPTFKVSSTRNIEPVTETVGYDTEQAYTNEQAYSQQAASAEVNQPDVTYSKATEAPTEPSYVPRLPSTRSEEQVYYSRSSAAPAEKVAPIDESSGSYESDFSKSVTEPINPVTEQAVYKHYTKTEEFAKPQSQEQEDVTTRSDVEITKLGSNIYSSSNSETAEEVPQNTPSYRIRARPGVRQYQQSTTTTTDATTSARTTKYDRKRPQAVTYRPAFDRRRTTMRIEEIEADLKTKQIHSRNENTDYRHPVYKPEPTTESTSTTASLEATSKRGQFRRRRPSYTTTSTETSATKKSGTYETKNRYKSRQRTTEKPTTEKTDVQTDAPTTTLRPYSRYARPRLSERYNKKLIDANEDSDDQETNYSFNRPRYANLEEREDDQWAAKYAADSFKPYNPNDIQNEEKHATTERRSNEEDIITARNDFDEILVSVTPASNKAQKIVPEIPPTLEALVEQTKSGDSGDAMSTFETMLDEVMKSLEEQDENEYSSNVLKHKGGEIGEIPPERIITGTGDSFSKATTAVENDVTTMEPSSKSSSQQQVIKRFSLKLLILFGFGILRDLLLKTFFFFHITIFWLHFQSVSFINSYS